MKNKIIPQQITINKKKIIINQKPLPQKPQLKSACSKLKINHFAQTMISINNSQFLCQAEQLQGQIKIQKRPSISSITQISSLNQNKSQKQTSNKLIPMPITRWQHQKKQQTPSSYLQDNKHQNNVNTLFFSFNHTNFVAQQNNLHPSIVQTIQVSTQTQYFDLIEQYDNSPKIYQIPVQMDITTKNTLMDASLQVSESAFEQLNNSWQAKFQNKAAKHQFVNFDNQITQNLLQNLQGQGDPMFDEEDRLAKQIKNKQSSHNLNNADEIEIVSKNNHKQITIQKKTTLTIEKVYSQMVEFRNKNIKTQALYENQNNQQMLLQNQEQNNEEIGINEGDINRIRNNQTQNQIQQQEIQELKERLFSLEQEKEQVKQELSQAIVAIASYKQILEDKKQQDQQKSQFQHSVQNLQMQINKLNTENSQLAEKNQQYMNEIEQLKNQQIEYQTKFMEQMHTKVVELDKIQMELYIYKNQMQDKIQNDSSQVEELRQILLTKNIVIQDLKNQEILNKDLYQNQITKLRMQIQQNLCREDQIQQEKSILQKKNINLLEKYKELNMENQMYKLRIERIKTADQLREELKRDKIQAPQSTLREDNQKQAPQTALTEDNQKQGLIKSSHHQKHRTTLQLNKHENTPNFKNKDSKNIKYSFSEAIRQQQNSQMQSSANYFNECQGIIQIQQSPNHSKLTFQNSGWPSKRKQSKTASQQSLFDQKLINVIRIYEQTIETQLKMIQELQDRVFDYLKDGLIKQNQVELLYSQLCQYQNKMNQLLLQKLDIEFDNQRLKKMIVDSQNKLGMLGNRLIRLAKTNSSVSVALAELKNKQPSEVHKMSKSPYNE